MSKKVNNWFAKSSVFELNFWNFSCSLTFSSQIWRFFQNWKILIFRKCPPFFLFSSYIFGRYKCPNIPKYMFRKHWKFLIRLSRCPKSWCPTRWLWFLTIPLKYKLFKIIFALVNFSHVRQTLSAFSISAFFRLYLSVRTPAA